MLLSREGDEAVSVFTWWTTAGWAWDGRADQCRFRARAVAKMYSDAAVEIDVPYDWNCTLEVANSPRSINQAKSETSSWSSDYRIRIQVEG